jgi:hypothetical protein
MNKVNVVCTLNIAFAGKWLELEFILLNKISMRNMSFLTCGILGEKRTLVVRLIFKIYLCYY